MIAYEALNMNVHPAMCSWPLFETQCSVHESALGWRLFNTVDNYRQPSTYMYVGSTSMTVANKKSNRTMLKKLESFQCHNARHTAMLKKSKQNWRFPILSGHRCQNFGIIWKFLSITVLRGSNLTEHWNA